MDPWQGKQFRSVITRLVHRKGASGHLNRGDMRLRINVEEFVAALHQARPEWRVLEIP